MAVRKKCGSCSLAGVLQAAAYHPEGAVIFHSPKACSHIALMMDTAGHFRHIARYGQGMLPARLFVSGMEERDAIFGGNERLQETVDSVMQEYQPQYVIIAGSCAAGVIGDDVTAVAAAARGRWGVPIWSVPCQGFLNGDYYDGLLATGRVLAEHVLPKAAKQQANTVVLISERLLPGSALLQEIERLLGCFGLAVTVQFPALLNQQTLGFVSEAALQVILGGSVQAWQCLRQLAEQVETRFAIPYLPVDYPVGYAQTEGWITSLGEVIGQNATAGAVITAERQRWQVGCERAATVLKEREIAVCIGRPPSYFSPAWLVEEVLAWGARPTVYWLDLLPEAERAEQRVALTAVRGWRDGGVVSLQEVAVKQQKHSLFLTTHELPAAELRQLFLPLKPPCGVGGLLTLQQQVLRLAQRRGQRGGVVYG